MVQNKTEAIRTLIVGAGKAGELIAANVRDTKGISIEIVGFIDDDLELKFKKKTDIPILGTVPEITDIVKKENIQEIIIALPSERGEAVRRVIDATEGCKLAYKILPRDADVLFQDFDEDYLKHIRRIRPEDLLGGVIRKEDQSGLSESLEKETILVTGAAGSIGSELSRQLAVYRSKKVVFYDWWENGMFELRNEILETNPNGNFEFIIGDMKDKKRINRIMSIHKPTTVFHAGAYKHVPLMEHNASEAIKNNIFGTKVVAEAAISAGVSKFVLVSTDKAVNPTNIMGATKRAAEKLINIFSDGQKKTIFCAVRFGNVVNSNGSAIPFFQKQIDRGGPVTVTHKDVTRFFMTIPEACTLILKAWSMGENNDLFVLDMGEPIKIYDLARTLIILNGYIPDDEIEINIIGLRPGEKLFEEVLVDEEENNSTKYDKIYKTQNHMDYDKLDFMNELAHLEGLVFSEEIDTKNIKRSLIKLVPTFTSPKQ